MTTAAVPSDEAMPTHHFSVVTEGMDLMEWATLDALYEAGCGDATVGCDTLEFDRAAPNRDEALCSALRDVESVPGLRVRRVEFDAADITSPILSASARAITWRGGAVPP